MASYFCEVHDMMSFQAQTDFSRNLADLKLYALSWIEKVFFLSAPSGCFFFCESNPTYTFSDHVPATAAHKVQFWKSKHSQSEREIAEITFFFHFIPSSNQI